MSFKPTHHLFAFVDALGFADEISKSNAPKVDIFLNTIQSLRDYWAKSSQKNTLKLKTLGDSIILACEIEAEEQPQTKKWVSSNHEMYIEQVYTM